MADATDDETIYPVETSTDRKIRHGCQARYWEFFQYEPARFKRANLEHTQLAFYIYQYQELTDWAVREEPYAVVHGLIRFNRLVSYGGVLQLIGGGKHCDIKICKDPDSANLRCSDRRYTFAKTLGELHKVRRIRRRKSPKTPPTTTVVATVLDVSSSKLRRLIRKRKLV